MAKMLSTSGYWGGTCTAKCGYCDKHPQHNKTAQRRLEKEQWIADADLDSGEPDDPCEDSQWQAYEQDMINERK